MLGEYCSRAHDQALLARNRALAHHSLVHAPDDLEKKLQGDLSNTKIASVVHSAMAALMKSVKGGSAADLVQCESRLNFLNVVRNVASPPSAARHLPILVIPSLSPHPRRVLVQYRAIGIDDSMRHWCTGKLNAEHAQTEKIGGMIGTIKAFLA